MDLPSFDWRKWGADIVLNGSIPWEIGFSGGLSRLDVDLRTMVGGCGAAAVGKRTRGPR